MYFPFKPVRLLHVVSYPLRSGTVFWHSLQLCCKAFLWFCLCICLCLCLQLFLCLSLNPSLSFLRCLRVCTASSVQVWVSVTDRTCNYAGRRLCLPCLLRCLFNCATVADRATGNLQLATCNCLDNHSNLQENNQKQIPRTQIDETHFISIKVARRLRLRKET